MNHVKRATRLFFFLLLAVLYLSILRADNHHLVTLCMAAYGLGSIPFGYLLARYNNHDLSKIGSGSIGATNVLRTGHKSLAALTLLLDSFKGWLAVMWLGSYAGPEYLPYAIALSATFGHLFPIWLDFKGGKGVATGFGVLLAIQWPLALTGLAIWLSCAFLLRISSLAALVAYGALPFLALVFIDLKLALFSLILALLVAASHKDNISRLLKGTEPKIGKS